jgi:hypothetical protein
MDRIRDALARGLRKGFPPVLRRAGNRQNRGSLMHRLRLGLAAAALFLFAGSVSAVTITLSEMSSDGTSASVLDATLVFADLGCNRWS